MAALLATACGDLSGSPTAENASASAATTDDQARRLAEIQAMVDAAALRPADLGVKKPRREETTLGLVLPCTGAAATPTPSTAAASAPGASPAPAAAPAIVEPVASHYWSYTGAKVDILSHSVFGYEPERGSSIIDVVRTALTNCRTWNWAGTFTMKVVGEFSATRPAGVDGIATYCHHGTIASGAGKGDKVYICDVLLSRGGLVAKVDTVKLTLAAAQKEIKKAIPLAAAALVKAVPAP